MEIFRGSPALPLIIIIDERTANNSHDTTMRTLWRRKIRKKTAWYIITNRFRPNPRTPKKDLKKSRAFLSLFLEHAKHIFFSSFFFSVTNHCTNCHVDRRTARLCKICRRVYHTMDDGDDTHKLVCHRLYIMLLSCILLLQKCDIFYICGTPIRYNCDQQQSNDG